MLPINVILSSELFSEEANTVSFLNIKKKEKLKIFM